MRAGEHGLDVVPARRVGQDVVAQPVRPAAVVAASCGDVVGCDRDDREVTRRARRPAASTEATPGSAASAAPMSRSAAVSSAAVDLDGDLERAVEAGAEAVGEQVVGLAQGADGAALPSSEKPIRRANAGAASTPSRTVATRP